MTIYDTTSKEWKTLTYDGKSIHMVDAVYASKSFAEPVMNASTPERTCRAHARRICATSAMFITRSNHQHLARLSIAIAGCEECAARFVERG